MFLTCHSIFKAMNLKLSQLSRQTGLGDKFNCHLSTSQAIPYASNCNAIQAITPANTSSSMIPRPPGTRLSNQRIGQGFRTSNNRNSTNPTTHQTQSAGARNNVIQSPTNSSQTIPPWSCTPISLAVRPQSQIPAANVATSIIRYPDHAQKAIPLAQKISRAAAEPKVPGATGAVPLPNPKARK